MYLKILGDESFLQKTWVRNRELCSVDEIFVVTNQSHEEHVVTQLLEMEAEKFEVRRVMEPLGRNTAPAIALGIKYAMDVLGATENDVMLVSPSDHVIQPIDEYVKSVQNAEKICKLGYIVTFGVTPTHPETGYGYIKAGDSLTNHNFTINKIDRFVEKPDLATAKRYLAEGCYSWNSGMFAFQIKTILNELTTFAPEIMEFISKYNYQELLANFADMPSISIDYAVMEKTEKAAVLPLTLHWSDVGSWDSVHENLDSNDQNNVLQGEVTTLNTSDCLVIGDKKLITLCDVSELIVIDTPDALFIGKKGKSQNVKEIVEILKKENSKLL
jgi:mannose-1-phosphate guanylyltransferase/mannose-6-phosphate isomerase